jgi:hypothetical protein
MLARAIFSESSLEALSAKMISICEKMVCRRKDSRQRGIHSAAFQFKMTTPTTGVGSAMFIKICAQNLPYPLLNSMYFPSRHYPVSHPFCMGVLLPLAGNTFVGLKSYGPHLFLLTFNQMFA